MLKILHFYDQRDYGSSPRDRTATVRRVNIWRSIGTPDPLLCGTLGRCMLVAKDFGEAEKTSGEAKKA